MEDLQIIYTSIFKKILCRLCSAESTGESLRTLKGVLSYVRDLFSVLAGPESCILNFLISKGYQLDYEEIPRTSLDRKVWGR